MGIFSRFKNKPPQKIYIKSIETERDTAYERISTADRLYGASFQKHLANIEKINTMYAVARDLQGFDGDMMQQCIDLCKEDIALVNDVCKYNAIGYGVESGYYGTFSRLAIIYEKRGEYDKAIDVCQQAIACGMDKDNNNTTIHARLARLIKKRNNQAPKIEGTVK